MSRPVAEVTAAAATLATSPTAPPVVQRDRRYLFTAAAVVALGSAASILSSTVVNVAVPQLERTFHSGITDVQWVLTAYLLGLAAVIPISGYVSDRFGTRRVYLLTLVAFTLASGLCGAAWNLQSEIAFRTIQGLAGGMVMPVGMTIIMRMAAPEERGRVMSVLGVPLMLAPALGPTVGGWLIQVFDYRWVFWVNIPAGVLAIAFGWFILRAGGEQPVKRLDVIGLLLATPGVTVLIYGLTQASSHGWASWQALVALGLGAALIIAFVTWELRRANPLLDMRVFRDAGFTASIVVGVIMASALFGAVFLVPVFMQQVQGYDTLRTGLLLAPQGMAAAAAMTISGSLTDRFGARPVVFAGVLVLVLATVGLTFVGPSTSDLTWVAILAARGLGMGFGMMPNFAAAYVTLPAAAIARATAVSNTMQRVASSFGIAIFATILTARLTAHIGLTAGTGPSHQAILAAARLAAARGFDDTFWIGAGLAALALPATMLLRRPLPPGQVLLAEQSGVELRHPPLSARIRWAAVGLAVVAIAFAGFALRRGL